jgi:hypothetical protein
MIGAVLPLGAFVGGPTAGADDRCTNQINYAGDPRSNAEINSIGGSSGQCPAPILSQAVLSDPELLGQSW